ncbi:MAG: outer membrane protein assembly factor BamB family protein [Anaerolineae bacterium]
MNVVTRRGIYALVLIVLAVSVTGCYAGGSAADPGWTVVAADGDAVYTALATGRVLALNVADGTAAWSYPVEQASSGGGLGALFSGGGNSDQPQALSAVYGPPAVTDALVLVASYNHSLYAFDRETGDVVWQFDTDGAIIGGATVADGVAYLGSSDHSVYAVDLETGKAVWTVPFATENWVWGAPAVDDGFVYVGSMDHNVYALNREDGTQVWKTDLGASVPGRVTLSDGMLFAGAVDRQLHALDATTGEEVWASDVGQWVMGEPFVRDGYVYVGTLDGSVHGLSISDGTPRWTPVVLDGPVRAGPQALDGQLIVVTEKGSVVLVDMANGSAETLYTAAGALYATPAVAGEAIYVGTSAGQVIALDSTDRGNPVTWVFPAEQ